jgi:hypothetical protein
MSRLIAALQFGSVPIAGPEPGFIGLSSNTGDSAGVCAPWVCIIAAAVPSAEAIRPSRSSLHRVTDARFRTHIVNSLPARSCRPILHCFASGAYQGGACRAAGSSA